jgi:DNA-binding NarL/FixJ family response regulator
VSAQFRFYGPPAITQEQWREALDECAELLSRGLEIDEIARRMVLSRGTICVLLRLIRELLGEQAI